MKDSVTACNVFEPDIRFGTKLDPAGWTKGTVLVSKITLVGAVEQRSFIVSAHLTVRNSHVLCGSRVTKGERTLGTDAIVKGRVDRAIGNADILASVHVNPVTVCVNLQIVDRQVVDTGGKNCKVAAMQDCDITDDHVAAEFQTDRLITPPRFN